MAPHAPFHGFVIFLDSHENACIVFEVHIRVDEEDTQKPPAGARVIHLGKAKGWQSTREDKVGNVNLTNIRTTFSFKRSNRTDDGEVLLVTPTADIKETRAAYDDFIRSLKFGR